MELSEFFRQNPKVAVAFSGGVDSTYLLYAAKRCGADVKAYHVVSSFQPQFEEEDVNTLRSILNVEITTLHIDVLKDEIVASNPKDRCYYCKRVIFGEIKRAAENDGYTVILDGTNASDDADDRPGMRALCELGVRSPLRECGLTKDDIRMLSKEADLFTWSKPAYACLATRIRTGERITKEKLEITEHAEEFMRELGFSDFRVRMVGNTAKIQVNSDQMELAMSKREIITKELRQYYDAVTLDMEARDE